MSAAPACDVTLRSSSGAALTVPAAAAWRHIGLLGRLAALDECGRGAAPPLPLDFPTAVVRAVAAYVRHPDRRTAAIPRPLTTPVERIAKSWEMEFVRDLEERELLLQTAECASYLQIEELQSLLFAWVAQRVEEVAKSAPTIMEGAERIRQYLHMENEWSPEEMIHLEKEMKYARELDPSAY